MTLAPLIMGTLGLMTNMMPNSTLFGTNVPWCPYRSFTKRHGYHIMEGDMYLPKISHWRMNKKIRTKAYLWKGRTIPYKFDLRYTPSERAIVKSVMRELQQQTCVRFVPKRFHRTYIRFRKQMKGCFAPVGRLSKKRRAALTVNLQAPLCFKETAIKHALLHVMGLFHEHNRPDRDDHINIHWLNVKFGKRRHFKIRKINATAITGTPYNYESLMHFPNYAFSRNGRRTISSKLDPDMILGNGGEISKGDIEKIRELYGCNRMGLGKLLVRLTRIG